MLRANAGDGSLLTQIGTPSGSPVAVEAQKALRTRTKQVSFQIMVGAAHQLLPSLHAGATSAVLAFAAPAPTACFEIYAAWKDGNQSLAELKQDRITHAAQQLGSRFGVPGVKYAMDLNGYYGGACRLPLLPLTSEQKQEIEQWMRDIKN
jgi:dihydrodipicolinate synthase/N-acetylneuraminate lyase